LLSRFFHIAFTIISLCPTAFGQIIKVKTEKQFTADKKLFSITKETYDRDGLLTESTTNNYRNKESISISTYSYNFSRQLTSELFSAFYSYTDIKNKKHWTDTSVISETHYAYDSLGRLVLEMDYSYTCKLDTCDITQYYYSENNLIRKCCNNACSHPNYNYPIYYKYDKNDSLILELAMGPIDTLQNWYSYVYDYSYLPDSVIKERFDRENDSFKLDYGKVNQKEYLPNGKISKITYPNKHKYHIEYIYNNNDLLKTILSYEEGKVRKEYFYKYNKRGDIKSIKVFNKAESRRRKLYYHQTYKYSYF
jgi:hypothetical protein